MQLLKKHIAATCFILTLCGAPKSTAQLIVSGYTLNGDFTLLQQAQSLQQGN